MSDKTDVRYEWLVEEIDRHGDIYEVHHLDSYAEARDCALSASLPKGGYTEIGLVRDRGNDLDGLIDRQWAYVKDRKLPERFDWGGGETGGALVPKKFHRELERY